MPACDLQIRVFTSGVSLNDARSAYCPCFLTTYLHVAEVTAHTSPLSPRWRELTYVGVYASTMHMFGEGPAVQICMALQFVRTPIELIEVLQRATGQGACVDRALGYIYTPPLTLICWPVM